MRSEIHLLGERQRDSYRGFPYEQRLLDASEDPPCGRFWGHEQNSKKHCPSRRSQMMLAAWYFHGLLSGGMVKMCACFLQSKEKKHGLKNNST